MDTALQKAIDSLQIQDVALRASVAELSDGFEPRYAFEADPLRIEFKHGVVRTLVIELSDGLDGEQQLFRVFIEFGARWVAVGSQDSASEPDVRARIECVMTADYVMREHPGDEALKAFSMRNASYHVWPYWREFLASQCQRMNLPKVMLPAVQFVANPGHTADAS